MSKFFAEKFNEWCGIVQVEHPETNEMIYVVYANLIDDDDKEGLKCIEAGEAIGQGKTKDLAYADAIMNLVFFRRYYDRKLETLKESIQEIQFCPFGNKERIVVPMTEYDPYSKEKLTYNADVFIRWNAKKVKLGQG